VIHKRFAEK